MKNLLIILMLGLFSINAVSADKLIAENPLIAVRVKSYNTFIGLVPQMLQMQVAAAEQQFPFLDKTKEIVVVMTSIVPPTAYAAVPLNAGTKMDAVNQSLPVEMQAKAQIRDDYLYLPLSGDLPQTIGKGKLPENKSTVQINFDIEKINKLNGPMITALMQQDFSQMLPASNEKDALIIKATMDFYKVILTDLLQSSKSIDVKIDKTEAYKIDVNSEFIAGTKWAAMCKKHSAFTIPETQAVKDGPMYFAGTIDYSSMKPFIEPTSKYLDAMGEAIGTKGMSEMMESFAKIGVTRTIGSFGMKENATMKMDYIMEGDNKTDMKALLKSMTAYMAEGNELVTMKEIDQKIDGEPVYLYSMKAAVDDIGGLDAYLMAKSNGLYYAANVEDLSKFSSAKISDGTKKGFMWMKMDMAEFSKGMALPAAGPMPKIEILSTSSETGMRTVMTIK